MTSDNKETAQADPVTEQVLSGETAERVLTALQAARQKLAHYEQQRNEPIAIVGMAGRFPGAEDVDAFWSMLMAAGSGLQPLSDEALDGAGIDKQLRSQPDYIAVGASFNDPTAFDAPFFSYSPREAELLDPQQRVFLECAWTALEEAGYDGQQYPGSIGVYAGAALNRYIINLQGNRQVREQTDDVQLALSNLLGLLPTRTSYHLDLTGPSVGVQTTCSTSLVAVHQAAQALLAGECDMALAGAAAVTQPKPGGYLYQTEGIASPDGLCRPFDKEGAGTVFGNGVGVVVLKRLSDAVADGDHIHGLIRGSAVNNDGGDKVGLTAPSVSGQVAVIKEALRVAHVAPETISYVEGHGTATLLGDPIEVEALNKAYQAAVDGEFRCALGSVKANVGHLDVAAGITGLIKTLLSLKHQTLPGTLNYQRANPNIDFAGGPFYVDSANRPWTTTQDLPRRAGLSSFGMGGTNAHMIVEQAPAIEAPTGTDSHSWQRIILSAKTATALEQQRLDLVAYLEKHPEAALADVAFTLQVGRRGFEHRLAVTAKTHEQLKAGLRDRTGHVVSGEVLTGEPSCVFMFSGQGSQYIGMAKELYHNEAAFKDAFDDCQACLPVGFDLAAMLWAETADANALNQTAVTQPALFVIEYALAKWWMAQGIEPQVLIGHSIGEFVAACLADVFSLADAIKVVLARGQLMQSCEPGAMLSVLLSEEQAQRFLSDNIEIAVINGPQNCVLAGPVEPIHALAATLEKRNVPCRLVKTSHAFHSAMMEDILEAFAAIFEGIRLNPPRRDMISSMTGTWLSYAEATDPHYWVQQLRQTVRFGEGIKTALSLSNPLLIEVGPGPTLTRLARQQISQQAISGAAVQSLAEASQQGDDVGDLYRALSEVWVAGMAVPRQEVEGDKPQRLSLPTYPFERRALWVEPTVELEPTPSTPEENQNTALQYYQAHWQRVALSSTMDDNLPRETWLIFTDKDISEWVSPRLPENIDPIWVQPGEGFQQEANKFVINIDQLADYQALLEAIKANGQNPKQMINAFDFGAFETVQNGLDQPGKLFNSSIKLAQLLQTEAQGQRLLISVVAASTQLVLGNEELHAANSLVQGLMTVLPQENPQLDCRFIDLCQASQISEADVATLMSILSQPYSAEQSVLAIRQGHYWQQSYDKVQFPILQAQKSYQQARDSRYFVSNKTYIIAGDLVDGLGLIYARALREHCDAQLILVGREGLPTPDLWADWLEKHSVDHAVSQMILSLQSLGEPGRDYRFYSGNLSDEAWLCTVIEEAVAHYDGLQGVFHTAAMGDEASCFIPDISKASYQSLLDTKMYGVQVLESLVAAYQPAFFVVQSSLSSLVGGMGLAAYAAANTYLDTKMTQWQNHNQSQTQYRVINWDVVQLHNTTADGGVALLKRAITPEDVWRVTAEVICQPMTLPIVVTRDDLLTRIQQSRLVSTAAADSHIESDQVQGGTAINLNADQSLTIHPRPELSNEYVAPRDDIEQQVCQVMADLLGLDRVGLDDNFFELGGHSLLAVQAVTKIRQCYGVEIPMRSLLFESPTPLGIIKIIKANNDLESVATANDALDDMLDLIDAIPADSELGQ